MTKQETKQVSVSSLIISRDAAEEIEHLAESSTQLVGLQPKCASLPFEGLKKYRFQGSTARDSILVGPAEPRNV